MNICYAYRKSTWYPHQGTRNDLPPQKNRASYLKRVKEIGFDGFEFPVAIPDGKDINQANAKEFRQELEDAGLSCLAIRGGGGKSSLKAEGPRYHYVKEWLRVGKFHDARPSGVCPPGEGGARSGEGARHACEACRCSSRAGIGARSARLAIGF